MQVSAAVILTQWRRLFDFAHHKNSETLQNAVFAESSHCIEDPRVQARLMPVGSRAANAGGKTSVLLSPQGKTASDILLGACADCLWTQLPKTGEDFPVSEIRIWVPGPGEGAIASGSWTVCMLDSMSEAVG